MNGRWSRQAVAVTVSIAVAAAPVLAQAQGAPGPTLQQAPGMRQGGDPPARVGRLALLSGTVSFHLAGADRWDAASLNLPVTTGGAFWTEPGARAALDVTGTRLEMGQSTELDMVQLDDSAFVAALPQGTACVKLRGLLPNTAVVVQTPRGQVSLVKDGRYEVSAGDSAHPTVVTVVDGEATVAGAGAQVQAGPNQAATITGDGQATPFAAALGTAQRDAFLTACLAEDQPARPRTVQVPADVERMTGGYALDEYGDWASTPDYGAIWYPPADPGYVPYRHGHWGYVAPWGWTWVDDAPWGFAPSHYGRWIEVQDRWGWIPGGGPVGPGYRAPAYPVYAPAVVSFLAGAAVGALAAGALDRGSVGWVPLGPREAYYPPYRASAGYVRNLNVTHVTNVNAVVNNYTAVINRGPASRGSFNQGPQFGSRALVNRAAATSIPAGAMAGSQNVAALARPVPAAALASAAPLMARPPITPTASTMGITPAVARQYRIQAPVARPAAPGPAFRPVAAGDLAARVPPGGPGSAPRPGLPAGLPMLRPAGGPQEARPHDGAPGGGAPGPAIVPRAPGAPLPAVVHPEAVPGVARPEAAAPRPALPNVVRAAPSMPPRPEPRAVQPPHAVQAPRAPEPPHVVEPQRAAPPPRPAPPPRAEPAPAPRPSAPPPAPRPAPPAAPRPAPPPAPRPAPAPRPEARPAPHPEARPAGRPHEGERQ